MSFAVFTDSCSNLPGSLLQHFGIRVLPCSYTVDGKQIIYGGIKGSFIFVILQ